MAKKKAAYEAEVDAGISSFLSITDTSTASSKQQNKPVEKTRANFMINKDLYEQYQLYCKLAGASVTGNLVDYIQRVVDENAEIIRPALDLKHKVK